MGLPRFTFPITPFSAYPKSLPYTSQTRTSAILRHVWDNAHTSSTVRYPLNATLWTNSGANSTNPTPFLLSSLAIPSSSTPAETSILLQSPLTIDIVTEFYSQLFRLRLHLRLHLHLHSSAT